MTDIIARGMAAGAKKAAADVLKYAIAPEYNESLVYDKGTLITRDGKVYKALENGITGPWDITKWEQTNVADLLDEIASRIISVGNIGRYLAIWDCTTGLPTTSPAEVPYTYVTGDYYIIGKVGESGTTNYKPEGTSYLGVPSTVVETETPAVLDMYRFDGTTWSLLNFGEQFRAMLQNYYTKAESDAKYYEKIPRITIATSQVVQASPLKIQLTDAQYAIIASSTVDFIRMDATALGKGESVFYKEESENEEDFVLIMPECNYNTETGVATEAKNGIIIINKTSKIGTYTILTIESSHLVKINGPDSADPETVDDIAEIVNSGSVPYFITNAGTTNDVFIYTNGGAAFYFASTQIFIHESSFEGGTNVVLRKPGYLCSSTGWSTTENSQIYNSYVDFFGTHTDGTDLPSYNATKTALEEKQAQIDALKNNGKFLAMWDATTGLPSTTMPSTPYVYKIGDYYRVGTIAAEFTGYIGRTASFGGFDYIDLHVETDLPAGIQRTHKDFYTWLMENGYDSKENPLYTATGTITGYVNGLVVDTYDILGLCAEDDSTNPYGFTKCVTVIGNDGICDYFYFWEDDDHILHCAPPSGEGLGTNVRFSAGLNYRPSGAQYTGAASTTLETEELAVGFVYYYDGTNWKMQSSGSPKVDDVQINNASIVGSDKIARIPTANSGQSGVIKTSLNVNTITDSNGVLIGVANPWNDYPAKSNTAFIAKGTLENVLTHEAVRVDKTQSLTDEEKQRARSNIGATGDVQVNGVSKVVDGVANIGSASNSEYGVTKFNSSYGVGHIEDGIPGVSKATDAEILNGTNQYKPVVASSVVYATKVGMTKNTALTDAEKATVRQNIGAVTQILVSDNL